MKRIALALYCLCLFVRPSSHLFAQLILDPQDRLYQLITVWEEKGYLGKMPLLRPYPLNLLIETLEAVAQKGDETEKETARSYLARLKTERGSVAPDRLLPAPFGLRLANSFWTSVDDFICDIRPLLTVQGSVGEVFSYSGLATIGFQLAEGDPAPYYTQISDEGQSGGGFASLGGMTFQGRNLGLGAIFLGTKDLYFQAGIMRSSFGPFFDHGVVLGPQAPGAGHLSFTWNADWLTVSSVLLIVNPALVEDETTGTGTPTEAHNRLAPEGHTLSFEKYLALHSFTFYPCDWWSFGIVQAVVFGGRFNPAYLFPFQHLPFTQLIFGDKDSSYLGLYSRFKLPLDLRLDFMFYLDDMNFNKFIGGEGQLFDINSGQNKIAFQAGLSWTPRVEGLSRVSFDYTMITPYTFTHDATAVVNFLSYTHEDAGLGSILPPNSDQLYLTVALQPASFLNIDFFSRFTRHGNASEGVPGLTGDGSYWDDGRDQTGTVYFYGPLRFLTQGVIEKILQIGVNAEIRVRLGFGALTLGAGYIFEYGWDRGLVSGNDGVKNYLNLKAGLEF